MEDSRIPCAEVVKRKAFYVLTYPFAGLFRQLLFRAVLLLPFGAFSLVEFIASNLCCRLSDDWFDTPGTPKTHCRSIGSFQIVGMVFAAVMWVWYLVGGILCALSGATMTFISTSSTSTHAGNVVTTTTTTSVTTSNTVRMNVIYSFLYSVLFIIGSSFFVFPQFWWSLGNEVLYC